MSRPADRDLPPPLFCWLLDCYVNIAWRNGLKILNHAVIIGAKLSKKLDSIFYDRSKNKNFGQSRQNFGRFFCRLIFLKQIIV